MTNYDTEKFTVTRFYRSGTRQFCREEWWGVDAPHGYSRPDGPACTEVLMVISNDENRPDIEAVRYDWRNADEAYRDPGLPDVVFCELKSGKVFNVIWSGGVGARRSFELGPAQIEFDLDTRKPIYEQWIDYEGDGETCIELHRYLDPVSGVCFEELWEDSEGRKHRAGGRSAVVLRDRESGSVCHEEQWIHGTKIPTDPVGKTTVPTATISTQGQFERAHDQSQPVLVTELQRRLEARLASLQDSKFNWIDPDEPSIAP